MKFWLVPTSVAVAALAGVLTLGSSSAISAPQASVPQAPLGAQATPQDVAAYKQLTDKLFGTPAQRRGANKMVVTMYNAGMTTCMNQAGFQYTAPAVADYEVQIAPGDLDAVAPLGDFAQSRITQALAQATEATQAAGGNPGFRKAQAAGQGAQYLSAVNTCNGKQMGASYIKGDNPVDNAASQGNTLSSKQMFAAKDGFTKRVADLQATPAAQTQVTSYRTCLSAHGFQAQSWLDLHEQIAAKFSGMGDTPWSVLNATPAWKAAVKYEQDAAAADTTCRATFRSWAIRSLQPQVATLNADPATAKLAAGWTAIEQRYTAAGLN